MLLEVISNPSFRMQMWDAVGFLFRVTTKQESLLQTASYIASQAEVKLRNQEGQMKLNVKLRKYSENY